MNHSKVSVIKGHALDTTTDKLYEPLRSTFLQDTSCKRSIFEHAQLQSRLTHRSKVHSFYEMHELGQKTLIPEDRKLKRRDDLEIPRNRNYIIVNVHEIQGLPISQEQLQQKMKHTTVEEIVYDYGTDSKVTNKMIDTVYDFPSAYESNSRIKLTNKSKYNMFSVVDQPLNNLMNGNACTCPANEFIASRNKQVVWTMPEQRQVNEPQ